MENKLLHAGTLLAVFIAGFSISNFIFLSAEALRQYFTFHDMNFPAVQLGLYTVALLLALVVSLIIAKFGSRK